MYEYAPQFVKRKEKLLCYGFLGLGTILFALSMTGIVPIPWVLQILAVISFIPMVSIFSLCLSRRYVYRVEEREGASPDLVITDHCGKRVTVVARISLSSIRKVIRVTGNSRREREGKQFFSYSGVLFNEAQYDVYAEECGTHLLLRICADDTLLSLLGGVSEG